MTMFLLGCATGTALCMGYYERAKVKELVDRLRKKQ